MSFEKRNRKHLRTWSIVIQFIIWILILFVAKILNQYFLGSQEWLEKLYKLYNGVDSSWFANQLNWSSVFTGPIGFVSFITFKTLFGTDLALPVLIDFIINWAFVLILLFYLVLFSISLSRENKVNRTLKQVKSPNKKAKPIKEEAVVEKPIKEKVVLEKPVKTVETNRVEIKKEPLVFKTNKDLNKKPEVKKPEVVIEAKEGYRLENVKVTKKHYEQTSKSEILEKLFLMYPSETKTGVKEVVDSVFDLMSNKLAKKEEVAIYGFGKLEHQHKDQREGINPLNGAPIEIEAANTVKFKPSKHLKENMSKQKWTGLYTVDKQIEVKIEPTIEPTIEPKPEDAHKFLSDLENKYENELKTKPSSNDTKGLSTKERSKLDGSDSIIEPRSELQKHANVIRDLAIQKDLKKKFLEVNLRDMTKKELISYMQKIKTELTNKNE